VANECPKCRTENTEDSQFCKKCATPLEDDVIHTKTIETPIKELTTGSVFAGRYQIIEELGKGGMGRVYKVLDKETDEKMALKLIKPEIASDKTMIERFRNELTTARKIGHRNVCRMYDLNKEKDNYYITMEFVSGGDLKKLIRRTKQLAVGTAISIAKQICNGLKEAHSLGIVHRDLKPNNIMIDDDGIVRIMDFGIARAIKEKGITGAGVMIGTPEYMSPEQVEAKEVDQRSDIYSLGIILYEMLTGRIPFEADSPFAVGVKHKSETPKNPKEFNPQIPDDLANVILRCLEKEKASRYQSAGEVKFELESIEQGLPTTDLVVPKKKMLTSEEITVQFRMKKIFIPAFVVIAIAITALILWNPWSKRAPIPMSSDKPSLAVLYFKNNTGDKNYDHWRSALSDLLISDLAQSKYIRVMGGDKLYNILEQLNLLDADSYSSVDLKKISERGGVNHLLLGNLTKAGDNFRINITLQDADTGEMIGSDSIDGKGEASIISMVDELTMGIKRNFKLSNIQIKSDIDREIGEVTTKSSEAYKYYHEGIKHDLKGDYPKVIEYMEKAVAIDPDFASAYHAMSWAYGNQGYRSEEKKFLKKAMDLSDRLSDREKYNIQGGYYLNQGERYYDEAIRVYEKLLDLYPDDLTGNNNLGNVYFRTDEWDKAIERYEACLKFGGTDVVFYDSLAGNLMRKGLLDNARQVLEQYLNNVSANAFIHDSLAVNYRFQGKYELALAELDKAQSLDPDRYQSMIRKGDVYVCMGDLKKAEGEYKKLLQRKEAMANFQSRERLGWLNLLKGRFKDARKIGQERLEYAERLSQRTWMRNTIMDLSYVERRLGRPDQALELLKKRWNSAVENEDFVSQRNTLLFMGITYLELKSIEEALKTADKLKMMIEQGMNRKFISRYYYLMGMIELERNNYTKAIEFFKQASPLLSATTDVRLILAASTALAYFKAGDLENARQEYERFISLPIGRLGYGDVYAKSFYMLGIIDEQQGNKIQAADYYEQFLDLWKDADPGLPELEDARKRLAGLKIR
jgi:serine/threonine protein kinase/Tfp pilus assembly protein PilF